jgi:hypothetical protein
MPLVVTGDKLISAMPLAALIIAVENVATC